MSVTPVCVSTIRLSSMDNRDFSFESRAQVQLSEQRLGVARPCCKTTPSALLPTGHRKSKQRKQMKTKVLEYRSYGIENTVHACTLYALKIKALQENK